MIFNPLQYAQSLFNSTNGSGDKDMKEKTDNLLKMLWQTGAWKQLPAIAKALEGVVNKENGVVEVVVRSAREIPQKELDAQKEKILQMAAKFGSPRFGEAGATEKLKTVHFKNEVDPNLVGGTVLLINGVKIDGSLLGQLERFSDQ